MSDNPVFTENFNSKKCSNYSSMFPENIKYAHAYVPFQNTEQMFDPEESLCKGTVFPDLYQPYVKIKRGGEYE